MPHACSPCFCPYTTENISIFGENQSPRSICQSRTHTMSPWTGSKRNREIIAFFTKSRSMVTSGRYLLGDRPQIDKNHVQTWQSRTFSPDPANRNREIVDFYQKSPGLSKFGRPMRPALTDQPKIAKNKNTHIDAAQFKSPPGSRQ